MAEHDFDRLLCGEATAEEYVAALRDVRASRDSAILHGQTTERVLLRRNAELSAERDQYRDAFERIVRATEDPAEDYTASETAYLIARNALATTGNEALPVDVPVPDEDMIDRAGTVIASYACGCITDSRGERAARAAFAVAAGRPSTSNQNGCGDG